MGMAVAHATPLATDTTVELDRESPRRAILCGEGVAKAKGCLWCLDPVALNGAPYKKPVPSSDIPCLGVDEELDSYLPKSVLTREVGAIARSRSDVS